MSMNILLPWMLKASIVLLVFGIGLRTTNFTSSSFFHSPSHIIRTVVSMNIALPVLAILIAFVFDLHPAVKIALVVLAVSPVPPILPNKARKAGGEQDFTIGLFVFASLFAIIFVPLSLAICERIFSIPLSMSAFGVAKIVLVTTLLPLIVGALLARFAPRFSGKIVRPVSLAGMVILGICILVILYGFWHMMADLIGNGTLIALAVFVAGGLAIGHFLGGPDAEHRSVLALATSARHPAMAIAIAHANFPDQKQVLPAILLYLLVGAVVTMPYMKWVKSGNARNEGFF